MGDKFAEDCLKAHNEYRRKHGAQPLTLNKKISEYSQNWAQNLANRDSGRFGQWSLSHSNCFAHGYGENCAGALADYDGGRVAKMWYDEIKDFRFGYGGFAMNTGHFTQVVWKGTKEMGVGRATARSGNFYVVANYAPPGNMQGAFTANVLPPGNYNIPDPTKPKKTGLEGEVCDLVGKNAEDTVKSIVEEVYSHVTTKKPESLWALLVVRGSKSAQSQNTIKGFVNYNLGSKEDKDVIVYEFQHPPDEMEAKATFLDEAWQNKVKLAFLEAQREKEKAADIQNRAAELFPDLKKYQRIIFKKSETVSWYSKWNVKLSHFTEVVGSWLVVVFPPPEAPKAVSPSEASSQTHVNHPLTKKTTKKTGLEGEVIDIITKKSEDSLESIANFVLQYLDSKTDSRWIVGVARGAEFAHSKNLVKSFFNRSLGDDEDVDVVAHEFENLDDEDKLALEISGLDKAWRKKVKLAFLDAQRDKDSAEEILVKAVELFPELNKYQIIIWKEPDEVEWRSEDDTLCVFQEVIGDWLVVLVRTPKDLNTRPATLPPSGSLAANMADLQLDEQTDTQSESNQLHSKKKLCTFLTENGALIEQHVYHCVTCDLDDESSCVCKVCVKLCHKGHEVKMAKIEKSFCDCGSDNNGICKANQ